MWILIVLSLFVLGTVIIVLKLNRGKIAEPACAAGECPLELHESDNGKSFVYGLTTRFQLLLNESEHPQQRFIEECTPEGVIGEISNIPASPNPDFYFKRYEAVTPGVCILSNGNFRVQVVIRDTGN